MKDSPLYLPNHRTPSSFGLTSNRRQTPTNHRWTTVPRGATEYDGWWGFWLVNGRALPLPCLWSHTLIISYSLLCEDDCVCEGERGRWVWEAVCVLMVKLGCLCVINFLSFLLWVSHGSLTSALVVFVVCHSYWWNALTYSLMEVICYVLTYTR